MKAELCAEEVQSQIELFVHVAQSAAHQSASPRLFTNRPFRMMGKMTLKEYLATSIPSDTKFLFTVPPVKSLTVSLPGVCTACWMQDIEVVCPYLDLWLLGKHELQN